MPPEDKPDKASINMDEMVKLITSLRKELLEAHNRIGSLEVLIGEAHETVFEPKPECGRLNR